MNSKVLSLLFFVVITGLLSCKDKDFPPTAGPTAPLNIVNATGDTIDFFVNSTRQNNLTPIYPGGATGYIPVTIGAQSYSYKNDGNPDVLFTYSYVLSADTYLSTFVGGASAGETFVHTDALDSASTILHVDSPQVHCLVRFVHASADTSTLKVTISSLNSKGADSLNASFENCAFKYVGLFKKVLGGSESIKVYTSGNNTPRIDTTLIFNEGSVYTLFTKGGLKGKGSAAFALSLMTNN
jgi:hypothetical protein